MIRRREKKRGIVILFIISMDILFIVSLIFFIQTRPRVVEAVTLEAGMPMVNVQDFVLGKNRQASYLTDITALNLKHPGNYEVKIKIGKEICTSLLKIVNTVGPKGKAVDQTVYKDEKLDASAFVTEIEDVTDVKVYYKVVPDISEPGSQKVDIVLEDAESNRTELQANLTVLDKTYSINTAKADFNIEVCKDVFQVKEKYEDSEAPQIKGLKDRTVYIGDSISYKKGVTVTDNIDKEVKLQINSSNVNLKREGTYEVIYSASDTAGNKVTKQIRITVKKPLVTHEKLDAAVEAVLYKILAADMTKEDKAWEIYQWIRSHIGYRGNSDKSDWAAEAYCGIKNAKGDCFTFYAVSRALLTDAGIDNKIVTRVGGRTDHYWNLINCGSGWYHFDACPNKDKRQTFMLTDAQMEELTRVRGNNYYTFDKSLLPATPESSPAA
jgi:hypothetical protein